MNNSFSKGLTAEQAAARLRADGPNELAVDQTRSFLNLLLDVIREPMFLLLLGAGAIYLAMGEQREAIILLGFVVIIMAVTILQESRTENTLEALRDLSSPRALVLRDGKPKRVAGREVVRDDILILSEGDRVPADGLVFEAHELAVDESMLTGESEAVTKLGGNAQVYAGSLTVRGQGMVRITAIGNNTELGSIGKSLQSIAIESSPLRAEMLLLTRRLAGIGVAVSLVLMALYWILRGGWLQGVLTGITLAMGILPQELPVIMIVFFALGARRIAAKKVLTRHLNAIETLGETTVLCVDKTGTLTQNRMAVAALCVAGETLYTETMAGAALPEAYHELLEYAVLASEITPHDPMELAFHRFAGQYLANTEHLHPDWALAREYEISPEQLAMSHLWRNHTDVHDIVASKGAPEAIADLCHLSDAEIAKITVQAEALAARGLRVLAVAKAKHTSQQFWPALQHDFDFELLGLVALADPLRPEVASSITECHSAGIRVVMITGDYPTTARAIAAKAGLDCERVLTGTDLANMEPAELSAVIASVNVFARVTPQQKLAIVEALKANGEVVAMTGDGVNDAPALKAAHIGIAMGKRGTDVAREAASLVLLEDDFSSIVSAIRLGRRIFANLRQALIYTLAVHVPIIGLSILPVLFGMPLILAPIHIAFLELVIDPACSVVFEAENGSKNLMQEPPRSKNESLVSRAHILMSMVQGLLITAVAAAFYWWLLRDGNAVETSRALTFVVLVTANTALVFASRSPRHGWCAMFSGLSMVGLSVFIATMLGLVLVTAIPGLAQAFSFQTPSLYQWLAACIIGVAMLILFESTKRVYTVLR
jgi:Ca2+-transporting ATPase